MSEYKIVFTNDKTNYIATDRRNKKLIISNDIKISRTQDGKICATFQNPGHTEPTFTDFVKDLCGKRFEENNSDCSIIIEDLSNFHYCIRKNGVYQLFGGGVTFNGTDHDDKLVMYECQNSTINLGDGNDTITIPGAKKGGFLANFNNNKISTGNGDDNIFVTGNFNEFRNNKFFLGKGNDTFKATINPEDDENITNSTSYDKMENRYASNVSGSKIYATDGKKGWFEKDTFESKTYSANELVISDFENTNVTTKSTPARPIIATSTKPETKNQPTSSPEEKAPKSETIYERRNRIQNKQRLGLMKSHGVFIDMEESKKGIQEYEDSFQEWVDTMK